MPPKNSKLVLLVVTAIAALNGAYVAGREALNNSLSRAKVSPIPCGSVGISAQPNSPIGSTNVIGLSPTYA
jgi:hypothetical protein